MKLKELLIHLPLLNYAITYFRTRNLKKLIKEESDLYKDEYDLHDVLKFAEWYHQKKMKEIKEFNTIFNND